jgi:hypothetical protein
MTLLVAAVEGPNIWMIADAAITGGDLSYRSREFELKVMSSRDGRALVGFAGDHHHGVRLVNTAAEMAAGQDTVNFLLEESAGHPSVQLAYAHIDQSGPHLVRIAEGSARELPTLYLGVQEAFDHFQRVRLDPKIDATPEAVRTSFRVQEHSYRKVCREPLRLCCASLQSAPSETWGAGSHPIS